MSAGVSIIGQCAECCDCPTAVVEWDSRSASLTKCGETDPTQPDKRFLIKEYCFGGQRAVRTYDPSDCSDSIAYFDDIRCCTLYASGGKYYSTKIVTRSYDCSYDYGCGTAPAGCSGADARYFGSSTGSATNTYTKHADCTETSTGMVGTWAYSFGYQFYKTVPTDPSGCTACIYQLTVTYSGEYSSDGVTCTTIGQTEDIEWDPCTAAYYGLSDSSTTSSPGVTSCTNFDTNICPGSVPPGCTGTAGEPTADVYTYSNQVTPLTGSIYSDEYTTADLKSNTVAALPAYDNDWNDTAGSFANLSTDETSYNIRESRYRLRFKIPLVGFGTCYKVTWVERFTPEGGGAVTDTPRCTIWDGTTPGGYVPATPSTYPILPSASPFYFEIPVPSSDGTTTVENVAAECMNCTACP